MDNLDYLLDNYDTNIIVSKIRNNEPIVNNIISLTKFLDNIYNIITLGQRLYHIKNNINHIVLCKYCNMNPAKYHSSHKYGTCSTECSHKLKRVSGEKTCIEKYGTSSTSKLSIKMEKMVKSNRKNHGGVWSNQTESTKEKRKKTYMDKLGVDHNTKTNEYRSNFSINNPAKKQSSKNKYRIYSINKMMYGVEYLKLLHYDNVLTLKDLRDDSIFKISKNTFQSRKHRNIEISILKNPLKKYYSLFEKEILNFLSNNTSLDIISNIKTIIPPYELDIYIPSLKLAIEANGDYWHANPKYYNENDIITFNNKILSAKEIWLKDGHKKKLCFDSQIKLIFVWESKWKNETNDVKNHLLSLL